MTWRNEYRVHPAADVFPMMSDKELDALAADLKANGLKHPIMLWSPEKLEDVRGTGIMPEEYLLDGRNRLEAAERAGISFDLDEVTRILFAGTDPVAYVISANIHRRHLTKQQQAELIVAVPCVHLARPFTDEPPDTDGARSLRGRDRSGWDDRPDDGPGASGTCAPFQR